MAFALGAVAPGQAARLSNLAEDYLRELNARSGIDGETFEQQLADPSGTLAGDPNLIALARAGNAGGIAAALLSGNSNAEGFVESLVRLALDGGGSLPGSYRSADAA